MRKVLFVANTAGFSKFNAPFMQWFKDQGWRVDNASPGIEVGNVDNQFDVTIERSPFSKENLQAYKSLKKIIEANDYDIIHCHTAVGGMLARLAGWGARKKKTKIIYTAHGFHFFKGAPLKYWLLFFPMELLLSRLTDVLITINQEDYELGIKYKMAQFAVYKIDGVGVNLDRFKPYSVSQRIEVRKSFGLKEDDFVLFYTAQFIVRKNHKMLIESLPNLLTKIPNLKVLFAGNGETFESSKVLAKNLGLSHVINFLGGRSDIEVLCAIADLHVATSIQEGLATSNIEAMACGCPIVVSQIRGHRDVCVDNRNGFMFELNDPQGMESAIVNLYKDKDLCRIISENNKVDAHKYAVTKEVECMGVIYNKMLQNNL
jgi:glycosyltransferase EpsD